ncbi:MAG: PepSY-associated TM helix domain-containing protein [Rufibacter sp.]
MKVFFRNIHLYLSLAAGLVIALVCFTGAVLVFEKELKMVFNPAFYTVEQGAKRVPLEQLTANLQQQVPNAQITAVKVYADPTRTVEFSIKDPKSPQGNNSSKAEGEKRHGKTEGVSEKTQAAQVTTAAAHGHQEKGKGEKAGKGGKGGGGREATIQVFMNPYTGQFLGTYNHRESFYFTMFQLHRWLLAQDSGGKLIVGISTVFFLFILVTGIVLWWPKNKKILKQRLTLKFNGGWKRINHDLHIVVGFYTALFLFLFAFTGLAWSFEWFNDAIYTVTGTENIRPEPPTAPVQEANPTISLDQAMAAAQKWEPAYEYISVNQPKEAGDAVSVTAMPLNAAHERASNQLFLHPYTGEPLGQQLFSDKNLGQRVRATFYPVHVGSIGGLTGRIIAFFSCLAGTTFPITGIILWVNRLIKNKRKSKKKTQKLAAQPAS